MESVSKKKIKEYKEHCLHNYFMVILVALVTCILVLYTKLSSY